MHLNAGFPILLQYLLLFKLAGKMNTTKFKTVDEYLSALPQNERGILERARSMMIFDLINSMAPAIWD